MVSLSLNQFLALYTWFPLAVLLFVVALIARFYERFSGRRTFFRFYALPVIGFGVGAVRHASVDVIVGDPLADAALAVAGGSLLLLVLVLYWRMMIQPSPDEEAARQPPRTPTP